MIPQTVDMLLLISIAGGITLFGLVQSQTDNDQLYILIDEISVFTCRGVKNEIKMDEDDINIINDKGNRAHYIKAPGNYTLHFKRITVTDDFGHLSGEIGVTLQVPILDGPAGIRFDLPYTMIPETGLLNQQCDNFSGIVQRDGRQYCRYCDICGLSEKIETGLNAEDHLFLPEVAQGREEKFSPVCDRISANVYEFRRTINLPGRNELERRVKEKMQGVDGGIKERLNKRCRCCANNADKSCSSALSFLYCNYEDCKSTWAQQCLHNSAHIAACFTVEFNYRMTTTYSDVKQFLTENNYPDQDQEHADTPSTTTSPKSAHDAMKDGINSKPSQRCVAKLPKNVTHLRRYCTIFWNAELCCPHCQGVC